MVTLLLTLILQLAAAVVICSFAIGVGYSIESALNRMFGWQRI